MAKDGRLAVMCSRTRRRLLQGCTLAALLTALAPGISDAHAAGFFGVNAGSTFREAGAQRDHHLDLMDQAGVTVVRRDAAWIDSEPSAPDPTTGAHTYHWAGTDATQTALAVHGLTWYPILDYAAPWAAVVPGDSMSGTRPDAVGDYAAYAGAFAARYGPDGTFWAAHPELPKLPVAAYELGNEPNASRFWHDQAHAPEVYADLYTAARTAIKAVDSSTPVVSAGLLDANVMKPGDFLRRMLIRQPSLRTGIDAVGYHTYKGSYNGMRNGIRSLRTTMKSLGMNSTPIEITEAGMTTKWVSESARAKAIGTLARTLPTDRKLNVTRFLPYEWTSAQQGSDFNDWWGIMRPDGTPTATGAAYLSAVRTAPARTARAARAARAAARHA